MADDGSKQSENLWPISKFYFTVHLGGEMQYASFQEVSGLDVEGQIIEYRHGDTLFFLIKRCPD
ncbi:phage tail protein [Flavobacterium cellulosilyticum]|uniref:phage tail protein n=1 Tax=Flavobacterium cellulosilyticum TaxID=2541731 RepID=UPI001FE384AA|nr:phage tail protein [Flavobacterium cellulosilyticum]